MKAYPMNVNTVITTVFVLCGCVTSLFISLVWNLHQV